MWNMEGFAGFGLQFGLTGFGSLFSLIALFMWGLASLFSLEYMKHYKNKKRYYTFLYITMFATIGVFLSADFFTLFLFFEMMSLASFVWVAFDERKESMRAAETYLVVAIAGGMVMLMGLFLLYDVFGTLNWNEIFAGKVLLSEMQLKRVTAAAVCLLIGFGAKAGAFPMHIWLPKAHPVAPAPASALLSGILTKTGIFGVVIVMCYLTPYNSDIALAVLVLGVVTMVLGGFSAMLSNNLKRALACSSVSQIGFILVGISMLGLLKPVSEEGALAAGGSVLHMVNHSLFKLVLFMAAGVVFMNLHELDLNKIRGFGKNKPFLKGIFMIGALGISGVPFFSGYVSKTLLHESIVEGANLLTQMNRTINFKMIEVLFLLSGGMTIAYMTKLFVALFVEKNEDSALQETYDNRKAKYINKISMAALTCGAVPVVIFGLFPHIFMDRIADACFPFFQVEGMRESVSYFSLGNLRGSFISIVIGAVLYFGVVRCLLMKRAENEGKKVYIETWLSRVDLEDFVYRPLIEVLTLIGKSLARICDRMIDFMVVCLRKTIYKDRPLPHEWLEGNEVTQTLGGFLNEVKEIINQTFRKKKPIQTDFRHKLAMKWEQRKMNNDIISRSMSFGLLMFFVGLIFTIVYLLFLSRYW